MNIRPKISWIRLDGCIDYKCDECFVDLTDYYVILINVKRGIIDFKICDDCAKSIYNIMR